MVSLIALRARMLALGAAALLPLAASAQPTFEDSFNGAALGGGWTTWDGYAEQNPADTANHAAFQMTGSQLSMSFAGGTEHNQWWLKHAQTTRPFLGSGVYEIKVDSAFTGAQQFGLVFHGANDGTFLMFMLYSYVNDQAKAYVERFSYVNGQQHRETFIGGGIGRYIPAPGPYYVRVTVDDHPLPQQRDWTFEWSANGSTWTPLVVGVLEGGAAHQNVGAIQSVGVFAGNQPQTQSPPQVFDAFNARFDYFRYYAPEEAPLPAPSNLVTRGADNRVDLWWDAVADADVYKIYGATTSGGPYTELGTTLEPSFTHFGTPNGSRHYYVVSAFQSGIEGMTSPEVDAVPHAASDVAQLPTNGLALVLSASELAYVLDNGESVAHWPTALGGNAVALGPEGSRPTFVSSGVNGKPAVRFDGVNDYMSLWGSFDDFSAGISMYVVAKPTTLQNGSKYVLLGNGASMQNIGLGRAGGTSGYQYFTDAGWGPVGWFNTPSGLVAGQSSLISLIQDGGSPGGASYATVAKNGVALAGGNVYVPPLYQRALNYIGRSYWNEGLFQGDIAEVIIYRRKLNDAEQATVRAYVAVKYGLAIDGHPGTPQPVEVPQSFTAVGGDNSVTLSWSAVTGATGYRVYRSGASQPLTQIAAVTTTGHTDNTVANGFTYQYRVTAYDAYSESPQSTPVTVTPTPPAQLPAGVPTSGLLLGLDAATALQDYGPGQAVGVWRDSSSYHNNAMSNGSPPIVVANAMNGKPVIRFDGVDDYFALPSGFQNFTAGMTFYVVARPTALQSGFKLLMLGNGSGQQNIGFGHAGSTSGLQYFTSMSSGAVAWFNTGAALNTGATALFSLVQQGGTADGISYAEVAKNGSPIYGQSVFVPPVAARSQNYIGNSYWSDGKLQGDVAEILLYNRALSAVEQAAVRSYIGQKYGITVQ